MDMRVRAVIPGLYSAAGGLMFLVICALGCIWGASSSVQPSIMLSHDPKVRALHVSIVSFPYGRSSVIRKRATYNTRALISWVMEFRNTQAKNLAKHDASN
jgi:hypothetical protein